MKLKLVMMLAASTLAAASCGHKDQGAQSNAANADETNAATGNAAAAVSADQQFANTAAASDAFEIQSSQLAATNASSSAVKSFAQHMVQAHTESTAKLKTAAAAASPAITPDATLSADQQQKLSDLKSKTGTAFDSAYVDDQVAAHQAALDGLKGYSASGAVPSLKSFATGIVPIVTAHLNSAKALKH